MRGEYGDMCHLVCLPAPTPFGPLVELVLRTSCGSGTLEQVCPLLNSEGVLSRVIGRRLGALSPIAGARLIPSAASLNSSVSRPRSTLLVEWRNAIATHAKRHGLPGETPEPDFRQHDRIGG